MVGALSDQDRTPSLERRLAAGWSDLSRSELRVASYFLDSPEEVAFLPAAELARRLAVSDATIIRTAQSLGYSGLAELKRELMETVKTRVNATRAAIRTLESAGDDAANVLDEVLDLQIAALRETQGVLPRESFVRALDLLASAERVHVLGFGPAGTLAEYMRLRLVRIGRDALAHVHSGFLLAESLMSLRPRDCLVVIAHGMYSGEVEVAIKHCQREQVPVVLLTDLFNSVRESRVTVALPLRRSSAGMLRSPATTLVVLDALLLGLAVRDRPATIASLDAMQRLREQIAGAQDREPAEGDEAIPADLD
jgi:DNA-binding MurR/RpiR family transcriptional regulator